ncbi:copper ion binding protein [Shimazuella kribbensis]|uniref:copper ion binding protein n=1 Tax=Shimazuella kribbensis TaxID=139808 RepID=UPI0003FF8B6D|nr:copper ion binding protein [Shimazuella kribbensis]
MTKTLLSVNGMSCNHCVHAIEQAVGEIDGTKEIKVELAKKEVSVTFDDQKVNLDQIVDAIQEEGYVVEERKLVGV